MNPVPSSTAVETATAITRPIRILPDLCSLAIPYLDRTEIPRADGSFDLRQVPHYHHGHIRNNSLRRQRLNISRRHSCKPLAISVVVVERHSIDQECLQTIRELLH